MGFCYSQMMGVLRHYRIAVVLVACIAFLSLRLVGDHLHFCFDGSEPLVSVHGDDGDVHHTEVDASPHTDMDIDLMSAVLKSISDALLPLALIGVLFLLIVPLLQVRRMEFASLLLPDSRFHHLRPPLRGPPR